MKLGYVGLGKMGSRMVKKLLEGGHEVIVWNRSQEPVTELLQIVKELGLKGLFIAKTLEEVVIQLESPRIIWSMLPAGIPTENVFQTLSTLLSPDDIFVDGGNAYFKDTEKRFQQAQEKHVRFLGIGVSGGIKAVENGFPLMAGGERSAFEYIQPVLKTLSLPNGCYDYFGLGGAGHFVKMVHNGVEYGMMQAIGEGFGVLEKSEYNLDLLKVAQNWQHGTIVSSFLIDRAAEVLEKDTTLSAFSGPIGENGEATWTIKEAAKDAVDVPVMKDSLQYRLDSQNDVKIQKSFVAKMVSALRFTFGGHEIKKTKI